jgi:hypothetical protein
MRWAELGPLVHRQLEAKKANKPREDLRTACDALLAACVDIRISLPGDAGTTELDEAPDAAPCRFDARTCELLNLEPPANARAAVVSIFAGPNRDGSDVAVVAAFGEYQEWLGGPASEIERIEHWGKRDAPRDRRRRVGMRARRRRVEPAHVRGSASSGARAPR